MAAQIVKEELLIEIISVVRSREEDSGHILVSRYVRGVAAGIGCKLLVAICIVE